VAICEPGTHHVRLTVTNPQGWSSTVERTVRIVHPNGCLVNANDYTLDRSGSFAIYDNTILDFHGATVSWTGGLRGSFFRLEGTRNVIIKNVNFGDVPENSKVIGFDADRSTGVTIQSCTCHRVENNPLRMVVGCATHGAANLLVDNVIASRPAVDQQLALAGHDIFVRYGYLGTSLEEQTVRMGFSPGLYRVSFYRTNLDYDNTTEDHRDNANMRFGNVSGGSMHECNMYHGPLEIGHNISGASNIVIDGCTVSSGQGGNGAVCLGATAHGVSIRNSRIITKFKGQRAIGTKLGADEWNGEGIENVDIHGNVFIRDDTKRGGIRLSGEHKQKQDGVKVPVLIPMRRVVVRDNVFIGPKMPPIEVQDGNGNYAKNNTFLEGATP